MVVGGLRVELSLEGCRSLKEKRRVVRGICDALRSRLGVSVAEVGDQELWNRAELGLAVVSGSEGVVDSILGRAEELILERVEVLGFERRVEGWG